MIQCVAGEGIAGNVSVLRLCFRCCLFKFRINILMLRLLVLGVHVLFLRGCYD